VDIENIASHIDFDELEQAIDEIARYRRGELQLTVTTVPLFPIDVTGIRENLDISQTEFAERFGIPLRMLQDWEEGISQPDGPIRLLMQMIEQDPAYVVSEYAEYRAEHAAKHGSDSFA
jgi:putative transcriptional regulator